MLFRHLRCLILMWGMSCQKKTEPCFVEIAPWSQPLCDTIYWSEYTVAILELVGACDEPESVYTDQECLKQLRATLESVTFAVPMMWDNPRTLQPHDIPPRPWFKVGVDVCEHDKRDCLIAVDYYSVSGILTTWRTRKQRVIGKLKRHFARYGIPCRTMAVNLTQKSSDFPARIGNSSKSHPTQRIHRVMEKPNKLSNLLHSYWKRPKKQFGSILGCSCIPEYIHIGILNKPSTAANVSKNEDASHNHRDAVAACSSNDSDGRDEQK